MAGISGNLFNLLKHLYYAFDMHNEVGVEARPGQGVPVYIHA